VFEFLLGIDHGHLAAIAISIAAIGVAAKGLTAFLGIAQGIALLISLGPVAGILLAIAAGLAVLTGGLVFAYTQSEPFRESVHQLARQIADVLIPAMRGWWEWWQEKILPLLVDAGMLIKEHLVANIERIIDAFRRNEDELREFWEKLSVGAEILASVVIPVLAEFIGWLIDKLGGAVVFAIDNIDKINDAFDTAGRVMQTLHGWFIKIRDILQEVGGWFDDPQRKIDDFTGEVERRFYNLPTTISDALMSLPELVTGVFVTMAANAGAAAFDGLGMIVSFFLSLPGRVIDAVAALPAMLTGFVSSMAHKVGRAIGTMIGMMINFFVKLPGQIVSAIASIPSRVLSMVNTVRTKTIPAIRGYVESALGFFRSMPGKVFDAVKGIPGKIKSAFGNMGSLLYSAGRDLLRGLISGIWDAVDMPGGLRAALGAVTSLIVKLKGPPEKDRKLLEPAGRLVIEGFVEGIETAADRRLRTSLGEVTGAIAGMAQTQGRGGGGTVNNFAPGSIVLDASKMRSIADLVDMLQNLRTTARQHGVRPRAVMT
jgi:phage-related protein